MKGSFLIIISITIFQFVSISINAQRVANPKFDQKINSLIGYKVPVISVEEVREKMKKGVLFLDAREREEFNVSHIPRARYVGYDDFGIENVDDLDKDTPIIVYCSIGYRSDRIGGKLKKAGFTNVYNLYGSIFEWANKGYPLEDANNKATMRLHTYNKRWSQWVDNPLIEKIW